jgi:hypothetical protein
VEADFPKQTVLVPVGNVFPSGALVLDGYENNGYLLAHPYGGGLQFRIRPDQTVRLRVVSETEIQQTRYRKAQFEIEGVEGLFEGWTEGRRWNGWATPHFEFETAKKVVASAGGRYDSDKDVFLTKGNDGEDTWPATTINVLGGTELKVYPVGAWAWIWDEVEL